MAFNINYLGRVSSSANTDALKVWTYNGTSTGSNETIGTLNASAYFNSLQQNLTAGSLAGPLSVGDVIMLHGSDASGMYIFDSITTNVTVASYAALGAISNSSVAADAAIAFSKLEVMTSGNVLVGSAANVATEVTMSGDVTIIADGTTAIGAGKVLSSMVSPLVMQYAAVTVSAAQFNGMYAAPLVLVAAGGANTLITLHRAELLMTYGSVQYANGGAVSIQYDSTINGAGIIASTTQAAADFFDAASTANAFEGGVVKQPFTTAVNKGLYLSNITGAFDTGDSDMVMHLWYSVVPSV